MVGFGPSAAFLVALPAIPLIGAVCCNVHQKAAVHTALNMSLLIVVVFVWLHVIAAGRFLDTEPGGIVKAAMA